MMIIRDGDMMVGDGKQNHAGHDSHQHQRQHHHHFMQL